MTVWTALGHQLRSPSGAMGQVTGLCMRFMNARPNSLTIAMLEPQGAEEVLDLGCGPGHALRLMADRAPYATLYGIDRSPTMLAQARAINRDAIRLGQVRLCLGTFERLPFPSQSMDRVLAVNVAYFWREAAGVLGEVRRVLKPGGRLAIYVTEAATMRRWKFAGPETHRLFDCDGLLGMLKQSAFSHQQIGVKAVKVFPGVMGLIASVN
jgi:ubiquinone/menaquinone biosynthesis C-methylase UbiE